MYNSILCNQSIWNDQLCSLLGFYGLRFCGDMFDSLIAESIFLEGKICFYPQLRSKNFEQEIGTWQYGFKRSFFRKPNF